MLFWTKYPWIWRDMRQLDMQEAVVDYLEKCGAMGRHWELSAFVFAGKRASDTRGTRGHSESTVEEDS